MMKRSQVFLVGLIAVAGVMGGGAAGATVSNIISGVSALEFRLPRAARPDVIKPERGYTIPYGDTFPVTIYEYVDRDHYVASGRTITYSFPPPYYVDPLPRKGESALHFGVAFDLDSGAPWTSMPDWLRLSHPQSDAGIRAAGRQAMVNVSVFSSAFPKQEHLVAAKSRGAVDVEEISTISKRCYGEYHWIGVEYCGFEMFEHCSRDNPIAREAQAYPFNTAAIFAHRDGNGGYDRIVECNHSSQLGWCWTNEPHPIAQGFQVYFGGPNLCEWNQVVVKGKALLDSHVIEETSPKAGWGKPYIEGD